MADSDVRIRINAEDNASRVINNATTGLKNFVLGFLGLETGKELIEMSDNFKNLTSKIDLATDSDKAFNTALDGVRAISVNTQTALENNVSLFSRLSQTVDKAKYSQEQLLGVTDVFAKSLKIGGAGVNEASSAVLQFSQAMGSGVLRGEEFNAINEASPRIMQALANGIGVPVEALRSMAEAGKLTTDVVMPALLSQSSKINAEFDVMGKTIGGAWTVAKDRMLEFVGGGDKASGVSNILIAALNGLSSSLGTVGNHINTTATFLSNTVASLKEASAGSEKYNLQMQALSFILNKTYEGLTKFIPEFLQVANAQQAASDSAENLVKTQSSIAEKLQQISAQTGVTVTSMQQLEAAQASGAIAFDTASGKYVVASEHLKTISATTGIAVASMGELSTQVANGTLEFDKAANAYKATGVNLAELSAQTGTTLKGQEDLKKAVTDGTLAFDAAAQQYVSTKTALSAISETTGVNVTSFAQLKTAVADGTIQFDKTAGSLKNTHGELVSFKTGSVEAGLAASALKTYMEGTAKGADEALKAFKAINGDSKSLADGLKKISDIQLQQYFTDLSGAIKLGTVSIEEGNKAIAAFSKETLSRLGVDMKTATANTQEFGSAAAKSFQAYIEAAKPTAEQIDKIKAAIISTAKTSDDLKAVGDSFKVIGVNIQDGVQSSAAFENKIKDISKELDHLSQTQLNQMATAAKAAFQAGEISAEQLRQKLSAISDQELKNIGVGFEDIKQSAGQFASAAVSAYQAATQSGNYTTAQLKELAAAIVNTAKNADDLRALDTSFRQIGVNVDGTKAKIDSMDESLKKVAGSSQNASQASGQASGGLDNLAIKAGQAASALSSMPAVVDAWEQSIKQSADESSARSAKNAEADKAYHQASFDAVKDRIANAIKNHQEEVEARQKRQAIDNQISQIGRDSVSSASDATKSSIQALQANIDKLSYHINSQVGSYKETVNGEKANAAEIKKLRQEQADLQRLANAQAANEGTAQSNSFKVITATNEKASADAAAAKKALSDAEAAAQAAIFEQEKAASDAYVANRNKEIAEDNARRAQQAAEIDKENQARREQAIANQQAINALIRADEAATIAAREKERVDLELARELVKRASSEQLAASAATATAEKNNPALKGSSTDIAANYSPVVSGGDNYDNRKSRAQQAEEDKRPPWVINGRMPTVAELRREYPEIGNQLNDSASISGYTTDNTTGKIISVDSNSASLGNGFNAEQQAQYDLAKYNRDQNYKDTDNNGGRLTDTELDARDKATRDKFDKIVADLKAQQLQDRVKQGDDLRKTAPIVIRFEDPRGGNAQASFDTQAQADSFVSMLKQSKGMA
ncbi:MAG: tape measure protein, partial [Methylococcales bacterium]